MREELAILGEYVRRESGYRGTIDPDADLLDSKILDSFSVIQLAMFVQEQFSVELEAEDLTRANLANLASIVALIDRRKSVSQG